jgi:hypothetical protein
MRATAAVLLVCADAVAGPACPPSLDKFAFVAGKPEVKLRDYAAKRWGAAADRAIRSPATTRRVGALTLLSVGRYVVVELPGGGFYLRDLGEHGEMGEMNAQPSPTPGEVIVSYAIEDDRPMDRSPKAITAVRHMIYEVWSLDERAPPRIVFVHEWEADAICCGSEANAPPRVSDTIEFGARDITIRTDKPWRATAATFHETPLPDVPPALPPWSGPRVVTYRRGACVFEPAP